MNDRHSTPRSSCWAPRPQSPCPYPGNWRSHRQDFAETRRGWESIRVLPDGVRQTHRGLTNSVVAVVESTVEHEDNGPRPGRDANNCLAGLVFDEVSR